MGKVEWTNPKGILSDARTVKPEVLDLLRVLYLLGIKSVLRSEFGWAFDHMEEWDRL